MSSGGDSPHENVTTEQLLQQLEILRRDLSKEKFAEIRGCFLRDHLDEMLDLPLYYPVDGHGPGKFPHHPVEDRLLVAELNDLFSRAGYLLEHLPNFGVSRQDFLESIRRAQPGKCRWATFMYWFKRVHGLNMGDELRIGLRNQLEWIDNVAAASATAIGNLITRRLSGNYWLLGLDGRPVKTPADQKFNHRKKSQGDGIQQLDPTSRSATKKTIASVGSPRQSVPEKLCPQIMAILREEHLANADPIAGEGAVEPLSINELNRRLHQAGQKKKDNRRQIRIAFEKHLLPHRTGQRVSGYKKYVTYCKSPEMLKRWIQRFGKESVSDELVSEELKASLMVAQSQNDGGPCGKCGETGSWHADFKFFVCNECYAELTTGQVPRLHGEPDGQADLGKISHKFAQE